MASSVASEAHVETVIAPPARPEPPVHVELPPAPQVAEPEQDTTENESPFPFKLKFLDDAKEVLTVLKKRDQRRYKRIQRVLHQLETVGPAYPSLRTHKFTQKPVKGVPDTYQSNVENNSPSAWRMWWHFDSDATGQTIVINEIGPHPSNNATY